MYVFRERGNKFWYGSLGQVVWSTNVALLMAGSDTLYHGMDAHTTLLEPVSASYSSTTSLLVMTPQTLRAGGMMTTKKKAMLCCFSPAS